MKDRFALGFQNVDFIGRVFLSVDMRSWCFPLRWRGDKKFHVPWGL